MREDHTIGVGGEVLQIQVDPDRPGAGSRLRGIGGLGNDRHEPLVSRGMFDHDLLDSARYRAAELDPQLPDLAQPETVPREFEPGRIILHRVNPLLPELADLSSLRLHRSQSAEAVGYPVDHFLQNVALYVLEFGILLLEVGETRITEYVVLKTPVPDKCTPRKAVEQPPCNLLRGICSVPGDVPHS